MHSTTLKNVSSSSEAIERDRIFAKLSQEDEEFRRKIVDLHRKLSDVDEERADPSKEFKSRAEESDDGNSEKISFEVLQKEAYAALANDGLGYGKLDERYDHGKRFGITTRNTNSKLLGERSSGRNNTGGDSNETTSESNFFNRFRIKRRSWKLFSFFGGKGYDRTQDEERTARLLKGYMPEKATNNAHNTISINHTSRDKRFWKLRSRRQSSST